MEILRQFFTFLWRLWFSLMPAPREIFVAMDHRTAALQQKLAAIDAKMKLMRLNVQNLADEELIWKAKLSGTAFNDEQCSEEGAKVLYETAKKFRSDAERPYWRQRQLFLLVGKVVHRLLVAATRLKLLRDLLEELPPIEFYLAERIALMRDLERECRIFYKSLHLVESEIMRHDVVPLRKILRKNEHTIKSNETAIDELEMKVLQIYHRMAWLKTLNKEDLIHIRNNISRSINALDKEREGTRENVETWKRLEQSSQQGKVLYLVEEAAQRKLEHELTVSQVERFFAMQKHALNELDARLADIEKGAPPSN